jgi:CDP-diacylglycerol--serine O-phosphatidyltransferase
MASSDSSSGVPPSNDGGAFEFSLTVYGQWSLQYTGQEKQKMLLSSDHGHFSMVKSVSCSLLCSRFSLTLNRALHLADLITEMNGKRSQYPEVFV